MSLALRLSVASAILTFLLFAASVTGDGTGLFGVPWLSHPIWSYILLGLAGAIILALTPPRRQSQEVDPDVTDRA